MKPLVPEKLRLTCDPEKFKFDHTGTLPALKEVVGQNRAIEAIDFGVNIQNFGFNIFVLGPGGAGRTSTIREAIEKRARQMPTPDDWCYVYNFNDPDEPNAITLPAGKSKLLEKRMNKLVRELQKQIPDALSSEDFQKEKNQIMQQLQDKQNAELMSVDKKAKTMGFALQKGPMGFLLVPIKADKPLTPQEYDQLSAEDRKQLDEKGAILREDLNKAIQNMRNYEQEVKGSVEKLERDTVKFAVGHLFNEIRQEFKGFHDVIDYLNQAENNLLENIDDFKPQEGQDGAKSLIPASPIAASAYDRFRVNVIVDNSGVKGAPVVVETNPTYNNLIGRIDKRSHMGALFTDFSMIKAGALHHANGGFLIIEAEHIFRTAFAWEALKRTLKNQSVKITDLSEEYSFVSTKTLEPEPIPLKTKLVLIGDTRIYYLLYNLDSEFRELFKVKADFNTRMPRTKANELKYAKFLSTRCCSEKLLHFDRNAVARIVEYGSELVSDQKRLSTRFADICDLARESNYWAKQKNHRLIKREDVQKAIDAKRYRSNRIEEYMQDMITEGTIYIDTKGSKVGQVNGLAVLGLGDYSFGKPSRISVRTYLGRSGVIAIDREVKMSGPIHDKGVLILSGFLNGKFGHSSQISMSASITFEQNYEGIEGDSASSTELYGLLSSLSGYPINQGIAVTGSVNQSGEIQPIGGVNNKIEGFYDVCNEFGGLNGEQGVMIPHTNVKNLMLREDVVDAVRMGKFHVYAVKTVDEGIEILTGIPAGKPRKDGSYAKGTVYHAVVERLQEMDELLKDKDKDKDKAEAKEKDKEG